MEPAPGSVTVTMSGATFPGGQGAVGWGRCRQDLAPPVLLGRPADADLAPLGASSRQSGGRGQRRDHRRARPAGVRVGFGEPVEVVGPRLRTLVIRLASGLHRRRVCRFRWRIGVIASHGLPVSMHEL
jgi:hypothetical protein